MPRSIAKCRNWLSVVLLASAIVSRMANISPANGLERLGLMRDFGNEHRAAPVTTVAQSETDAFVEEVGGATYPAEAPERKDKSGSELSALDREQLGLLSIDTSPILPLYINVAASKLTLVSDGMPVFAVENADCSVQGNFIIGSYGRALSARKYVHHGRVTPTAATRVYIVSRQIRFAANNFFGTVANTESIVQLSESVADDQFWCIPRREFCYENVDFRTFGGQGHTGDLMRYRDGWVFSAERGLITALAAAVSELCALGGNRK